MPTDTCKLCLKPAELHESHLLPAAVYRMCRNENGELAEPIGIRNDPKIKSFRVFTSSRQITGKVLCFSCEQLLNLYGEDWVLPQLSTLQGFPLHEKLMTITPEIFEPDLAAYAAVKSNDIRTDCLTHFAMGIFWKAGVHSWQTGHGALRLEFGPYREEIRAFLLGGLFPKNAFLMISVVPPSLPTISAYVPYTNKTSDFTFHTFYVPGVEFMLALTNRPPDFLRTVCIASNPLRPIIVGSFPAKHIAKVFAEAFEKGHIPANLKSRIRRVDRQ